jgi:hypothetical protein
LHYLAARVPATNFEIASIVVNPTTFAVTLTWQATIGAAYTVQRAPAITGPWGDASQVIATDDPATFTDTAPPAGGTRFYRIRRN